MIEARGAGRSPALCTKRGHEFESPASSSSGLSNSRPHFVRGRPSAAPRACFIHVIRVIRGLMKPFGGVGKQFTVKQTILFLVAIFIPALVTAQSNSQQQVADELLAADRAFSAASAKTDVISGLSAMFAAD